MFLRALIGMLITICMMAVTSPLRADEPAPAHETLQVESIKLGETRVVNIWLPPGYEAAREPGYPVLYMPDGGIKEDFPHVATTVNSLVRNGSIPPMLVVGIENTQRRRDMTGPTEVAEDRKIAPVIGGSGAFRSFIADELMPMIHKRYAVNGRSAIIGESAAALFIVETFFLQPKLFDTYIALDPSLWWNNQQWSREAESRLNGMEEINARLVVASADANGNGQVTVNFIQALCEHPKVGLAWVHVPRPNLRHDTIYRGVEKTVLTLAFSKNFESSPDCPDAPSP